MEWMKQQNGQLWKQSGVCAFVKGCQTSASHTEAKDVSVEVIRKRQELQGIGGRRRSTDCGGEGLGGREMPAQQSGNRIKDS